MSIGSPFGRAGDAVPGESAQRVACAPVADESEAGERAPCSMPESAMVALRMRGKLDIAALARSLQAIVRRHDVLRSTFDLVDGTPRRCVKPDMALPISLYDLHAFAHDEQEQRVCALLRQASRPFDLARGPLIRAGLMELRQSEHVFMLSAHPVVADARSMAVLYREIAALYAAFVRGMPSPLPPVGMQYADYAARQRASLGGAQRETGPTLKAPPAERSRSAAEAHDSGRHHMSVDAALSTRLHALARQTSSTLSMVLHAVYAMLLSGHARQDDICITTGDANRAPGTEALVGPVANQFVLRSRLRGAMSFTQLLSDVRAATLDATLHQDLPFDCLLDAGRPEGGANRTPLFQAALMMRDETPCSTPLPGLDVETISHAAGVAGADLSLACMIKAGRLHCTFDYSAAIFDGATIALLAGEFERLLGDVVAQPSARLDALAGAAHKQCGARLDP